MLTLSGNNLPRIAHPPVIIAQIPTPPKIRTNKMAKKNCQPGDTKLQKLKYNLWKNSTFNINKLRYALSLAPTKGKG
jgi:hypothetical protein